MVLKNPKAQMVLVLAAGLLAGYAAASGDASSGELSAARYGISKAGILLAAHNSAVEQKVAESGKKPPARLLSFMFFPGSERGCGRGLYE